LNRKSNDILLLLRIISDVVMVCSAWAIAYGLRFSGLLPIPKGLPEFTLYLKLMPFVAIIWLLVFTGSGFYRRTGHHKSAFLEALDVLQSCVLATIAFISFTYLYEEYRYSRVVMIFFAGLHPWLIIAGRSAIRKAVRVYKRNSPARKTLLIGGGQSLRHAIEMARVGDLTRSQILGVIFSGNTQNFAEQNEFLASYGLTKLETPSDWVEFLTTNRVESVVFAVPHRDYEYLESHLDAVADQVPDIKMIPDLVRFTRFAAGIDIVDGTPIVTINESPLTGLGSVFKRIVDIAGAAFALTFFSPIMLTIAIAVKFSSKGPILYYQERMGLDGRIFKMLKFRSMPVNAEAQTGAVWAKPGDDRATPFGKWLRRTSLDELPQFFNVLRGQMSLVGPRPERQVFVDDFRKKVPGYYLRHKTKAGITGWAQVNGWRGNTSIEKRIECDLYYIQNWSIWLDFRIMFLTIFRGFLNKNAY
jgi:Undecaprenyl-phosphate glucose phosphotransferase